jgi:LysM repeat protein
MRRSLAALALAVVLPMPALMGGKAHADVVVKPGETLSEIADRHRVSLTRLMQANGISNPDLVVAGQRLVLPGSGSRGSSGRGGSSVMVQPGDTLSDIAARHGMSVNRLMQINGITNPDLVVAGQRLVVSGGSGGGASRAAAPAPSLPTAPYTVKSGETLSEIADRFGTTTDRLIQLNRISNPNLVVAGTRLSIPGRPSAAARSSGPARGTKPQKHVVQEGESLSAIADRYGMSVDRLIAINNISDPDLVWAGSHLKLQAPPAPKPASKPAPRPPAQAKAKPAAKPVAAKPVAAKPATTPTASTKQPSTQPQMASRPAPTAATATAATATATATTATATAATATTAATTTAATSPTPSPQPQTQLRAQVQAQAQSQPQPQADVQAQPVARVQPMVQTVAQAQPALRQQVASQATVTPSPATATRNSSAMAGAASAVTTSAASTTPAAAPVAAATRRPSTTLWAAQTTKTTATPQASTSVSPSTKTALASAQASTAARTATTRTTTATTTATATATTKTSTKAAARTGGADWRSYGPLQVDWSNWQPMGGSYVAPTLNGDGQALYLAVNCGARKLNATSQSGQWKSWDAPQTDFEQQLITDLCKAKGS